MEALNQGDRPDKSTSSFDTNSFSTTLLIGFFFLLICLPRLFVELHLDEFGSFWVVKDGFNLTLERSIQVQGQSPFYYVLLWANFALFGSSPLALRVPSFLFISLSGYFFFLLTRELFNRNIASLSTILFFCCDEVITQATSARPYALAICLAIFSSLNLTTWLIKERRYSFTYYAFSIIGVFYSHYVFSTIIAIHVTSFFIIVHKNRGPRRTLLIKQAFFAVLLVVLLLLPLSGQFYSLVSRRNELGFESFPTVKQLIESFFPVALWLPLFLSLLFFRAYLVYFFVQLANAYRQFTFGAQLALQFIIFPPLALYFLSLLLGESLFLPRYYSHQIVGVSLLGGLAIHFIKETKGKLIVVSCIVTVAILAQWAHSTAEGWQALAERINEVDPQEECLLLASTGFIESQTPRLLQDEVFNDFMKSPLHYYNITREVTLLPYSLEFQPVMNFYFDKIDNLVKSAKCVLIIYRIVQLSIDGQHLVQTPTQMSRFLDEDGFYLQKHETRGLASLDLYVR